MHALTACTGTALAALTPPPIPLTPPAGQPQGVHGHRHLRSGSRPHRHGAQRGRHAEVGVSGGGNQIDRDRIVAYGNQLDPHY